MAETVRMKTAELLVKKEVAEGEARAKQKDELENKLRNLQDEEVAIKKAIDYICMLKQKNKVQGMIIRSKLTEKVQLIEQTKDKIEKAVPLVGVNKKPSANILENVNDNQPINAPVVQMKSLENNFEKGKNWPIKMEQIKPLENSPVNDIGSSPKMKVSWLTTHLKELDREQRIKKQKSNVKSRQAKSKSALAKSNTMSLDVLGAIQCNPSDEILNPAQQLNSQITNGNSETNLTMGVEEKNALPDVTCEKKVNDHKSDNKNTSDSQGTENKMQEVTADFQEPHSSKLSGISHLDFSDLLTNKTELDLNVKNFVDEEMESEDSD